MFFSPFPPKGIRGNFVQASASIWRRFEKKYFKKTSEEMYSELKPDFIFPKLESFLNQFSTELNDNEQD